MSPWNQNGNCFTSILKNAINLEKQNCCEMTFANFRSLNVLKRHNGGQIRCLLAKNKWEMGIASKSINYKSYETRNSIKLPKNSFSTKLLNPVNFENTQANYCKINFCDRHNTQLLN